MSKIDTAFVLAAGYGKRLRPLTDTAPKPLLPVRGAPVICSIFDKLAQCGFRRIIVNTHHLPEAYSEYFARFRNSEGRYFYKCAEIIFIHESEILDTGGGIKNALELLGTDKPVLVHNGDIYFDAPLEDFLADAEKNASDKTCEASLCLRDSGNLLNVGVCGGSVCDIRGAIGARAEKSAQYTGVFVLNPPILKRIKDCGARVFSIVDVFLDAIRGGKGIAAFFENRGTWTDIGTPGQYIEINKDCAATPPLRLAQLREAGFFAMSAKPVEKGGSARDFIRFNDPEMGDLMGCFYSPEKRENFLYAKIAEFLSGNQFPVPQILFHDEALRMLVMRDMGKRDLASLCSEKALYRRAITHIKKLHTQISDAFKKSPFELSPPFDDALYLWEQNYFFNECVNGRFAMNARKPEKEFELLRKTLCAQEPVLLHRDLQSQNIIVSDDGENLSFIDFQGMRFGCAFYDLASLLFDPYVSLSSETRRELFDFYNSCEPATEIDEAEKVFYFAAAQRLMQALGAYGFLSIKRNKPEYENYFAPALDGLMYCADKAGLSEICGIAEKCRKLLPRLF